MADTRASDSVIGLFLRIYWIMLGNAVMVVTATLPVAYPKLATAPLLAAHFISVVALVAARYLDIRYCSGQTVDGTPANMGHWRRYLVILLPVSLLLPGIAWALGALISSIG